MAKSLLIVQEKSTTQSNPRQKNAIKALGLRGIGTSIYRKDTRAIRGLLNKVRHMIRAEQVEPSKTSRPVKPAPKRGFILGKKS